MRISKRALALTGALAMAVVGTTAVSGAGAAAPPPVDVSNHSVRCNSLFGKIKFSNPISFTPSGSTVGTVVFKASDCTDLTAGVYDPVGNPDGVSLKGATIKGTIELTSNGADALLGLKNTGVNGHLTAKWSTNPKTPKLVNPLSEITITGTRAGLWGDNDAGVGPPSYSVPWLGASEGAGLYALFQVGSDGAHGGTNAPTVTGSFRGAGGTGAGTTLDIVANQSAGTLLTDLNAKGIKQIIVGIGTIKIG